MEMSAELMMKIARYIELREQSVKQASRRDPLVDVNAVDTADALIKAGSYTEAQRGALIETLLNHTNALTMLKKIAGRPIGAGQLGQPADSAYGGTKMGEADAAYLKRLGLLND
jgi:hypothetical protein